MTITDPRAGDKPNLSAGEALRERELRHFLLLDRVEQESAIRRLKASGMPEHTIAAATGLSVEQGFGGPAA